MGLGLVRIILLDSASGINIRWSLYIFSSEDLNAFVGCARTR